MFNFLILLFLSIPAQARLHIDDPKIMQALEAKGFSFAKLAMELESKPAHNKALFENPAYKSIVLNLLDDLEESRRADKLLGTSMRSSHRLFDLRWMYSSSSYYELVGVVNRLDRAPFRPGSCGEIRFIYRLAYKTPQGIYSRLPLTFNVVYWALENCKAAAEAWEKFEKNPLLSPSPSALRISSLKSVEVNLQSVRWPSTIRPDMGGYAEYILRVFERHGEKFNAATLENTPDVERLEKDKTLKARLLAWISDPKNLSLIDRGIAVLPDEFLSRKARSVALDGTHRLANAPFHQVFSEDDFKKNIFWGMKNVKSSHGLLKRLNDSSCVGCHQGRTVAGFHFLGIDRIETDSVNAILMPSSPHFLRDQLRREAFQKALLEGNPPSPDRPLSVRADKGEGGSGSHCGLGDPSFSSWTCKPGLECRALIADEKVSRTGICYPKAPIAGSFCQPGIMKHSADPHNDKVSLRAETPCRASQFCEATAVGFPGGMCSGSCEDLGEDEVCGSIAVLQSFNDCLAKGKKNFSLCLRENVRPGALARCSEHMPCRDDYICTRTKNGEGACIPPYFLFQLRVDCHAGP